MGLSLRNIGKDLGGILSGAAHVAQGVERQVNPFDNGATYSNPAPQHPNGVPGSLISQVPDVAAGAVRFIPQFAEDYANTFANVGNRLGGGQNQNIQQNMGSDALSKKILAFSQATGQNKQLAGDVAQVGLSALAPGEGKIIEGGVAHALPGVANTVLPRVVSNATIGAGFNAANAAGNGADLGQTAKAAGLGALVGGAFPLAGEAAKPVISAVDNRVPLNAVGAVGKNKPTVKLPTKLLPNAEQNVFDQNPLKVPEPKTTSERFPSAPNSAITPIDEVMANTSGKTPAQEAGNRIGSQAQAARNVEAEQAALNHLQNGGTKDEAVNIYKQTASTTLKDAKFRVQRVAKEANQALHPNQESVNPELVNFDNSAVALGDHATAKARYKAASNLADFHQKQSLKALDKLTPTDRADFVHYAQGVKDIASAEHPESVQTAVDTFRKGADTIHAIDTQQAGGNTRHIANFFPDYWDAQNPQNLEMLQQKAEQTAEEEVGPEAWRNMTNDERAQTLAPIQQRISLDTGNYQGFRNQQRLFGSRQEGLNAGFTPRFADPAEDIKNYFTSAKLSVAPQVLIKGARGADIGAAKINKSIDLPGDTSFQTSPAGYKILKSLEQHDNGSVLWKPYDTASSAATQAIVLNPLFHGSNQIVQGFVASGRALGLREGPGGGMSFLKNAISLSNEDAMKYSEGFLKDEGHYPTYGKNSHGIIATATHGVTNANRAAMAGIEARLRTSAYKTLVDSGMDGKEAVKAIDHYMGAGDAFSPGVRRGTLFLHYFATMSKALAGHVIHPIENAGSSANLIIAAAATYAASKALQDATGNKKAFIRPAGELSLGKEIIGSAEDIKKGHYRQSADLFTNRVNPVLKEGATQLYGKDLFTGQDIADRKQHAAEALVAPLQQGSKVTAGKKSLPEIIANQLQINTPHAKGYVATTNPKLAFLNTKGAKTGQNGDTTGLKGQAAYFDSMEQAGKGLNSRDAQKFKEITTTETDAAGNKVGLNDKQTQAKNLELSANPRVLAAYTKQKQDYAQRTGQKLDPLYDKSITPDQRATYLRIQGTPYKSDDYNNLMDQNSSWVKPLNDARNAYFDSVDFSQAPKSERVLPPKFDSQTEADFNAANLLDGKEKSQFILDHPNLQDAYDKIAKYTNDRRTATGYSKFNLYPEAPADVQAIENTYNSLPQHDGSKGGNKSRSLWIQAHPDEYAKMTDYMTKESIWELANNAGQAKYEGNSLNQQALKAAYNLGQYDIKKNSDGTYSLGSSYSSSGGGSSSKVYSKTYYTRSGVGGGAYVSRTAAELANPYFDALDIGAGGKKNIGKASKPKVSKTVSFKPKVTGYKPKANTGNLPVAAAPAKLKANLKKSKV